MSHKLSVVMPCYNCVATLEEAVASVYTQQLHIPYEVVMVDDSSTDDTRQLIIKLAEKYPNIRYKFHDKNKGGGATRNTAVEYSQGDLIFCLDSDDILTSGMLSKMVAYLDEKDCDAVGISKSIKFRGRNINSVAYITNFDYVGQQIPFDSLWDGSSCSLFSTFLHTKKAFDIVGGYPIDHGFDTQGFAFRFLVNGLNAYTCPDATYLHRINLHKSYYVREFEAGKSLFNWLKVLEEILFLFDDKVKEEILNYDIYSSDPFKRSIIRDVILKNKEHLFVDNYLDLIQPYAFEKRKTFLSNNLSQCDKYDLYWLGLMEQKQGNFELSINYFSQAIIMGLNHTHAYRQIINSLANATGVEYTELIEKISNERFQSVKFMPNLFIRIVRKLNRVIFQ